LGGSGWEGAAIAAGATGAVAVAIASLVAVGPALEASGAATVATTARTGAVVLAGTTASFFLDLLFPAPMEGQNIHLEQLYDRSTSEIRGQKKSVVCR